MNFCIFFQSGHFTPNLYNFFHPLYTSDIFSDVHAEHVFYIQRSAVQQIYICIYLHCTGFLYPTIRCTIVIYSEMRKGKAVFSQNQRNVFKWSSGNRKITNIAKRCGEEIGSRFSKEGVMGAKGNSF